MERRNWNTYKTRGYTHDVAQDQSSAGGVHHHQVRRTKSGWQHRIEQANGMHTAYSEVRLISDEDGEAAFATATATANQ